MSMTETSLVLQEADEMHGELILAKQQGEIQKAEWMGKSWSSALWKTFVGLE